MLHLVVEEILPKMDPKNVHNTAMLLLPVIKTMKDDGEFLNARCLFETHVCRNFALYFGDDGTTPMLSMFKPLMYLLDVLIYVDDMPNLDEVIAWAAMDDNGVSTDFLDGLITSLGWSLHCLVAELCLELSKISSGQEAHKAKLQQKSLALARKSFDKMIDKDSESIKFPIAFEDCESILIELDNEYEPIACDGKDTRQQEAQSNAASCHQHLERRAKTVCITSCHHDSKAYASGKKSQSFMYQIPEV